MSIYKRASGRYAVLIDLERADKGKRRRRPFGTFTTKKEAERAEREALTARDKGTTLSPEKLTVSDIVARYIARHPASAHGGRRLSRSIADSQRFTSSRIWEAYQLQSSGPRL